MSTESTPLHNLKARQSAPSTTQASPRCRRMVHPKRPQWMRVAGYAWGTVLTLITVGVVVVFLSAAYSDHVSPHTFLYFSYLGIAFPIILTLSIGWLVMLVLMHRWWLSAAMLLTLAIAFEPITRFLPIPGGKSEAAELADAPSLTLMSYNTCRMGQARLSQHAQAVPVIDFIKKSDADIVCLQEYGFSLSRDGHTEARIKKELSQRYPYYNYLPYSGVQATGIALYSRYPIREARRIDTRKHYFAAMLYRLNVDGREVALINYHLHSNAISPNDRVFYDNMVEHFEADSINRIHYNLVRKLGRAFLARAPQSQMVDSVRNTLGDDVPLLICGDMNDTPVSYCYRTIRGDLGDTWEDCGFGPGITFYKHKFWFRIDHIFHSRNLRPVDIEVLTDCHYSDHYPVVATFRLTP